jgi:predicted O-methyltransferase YrrM
MRNTPVISSQTETFLRNHLLEHKPKKCIEIGSADWYSSIVIAQTIAQRDGHLTTFEIAFPAYKNTLYAINITNTTNIKAYHGNFLLLPHGMMIPKEIDRLFVDAQKSNYGEYIYIMQHFLTDNAYIILDDVIRFHNKLWSLYTFLEKNQIKNTIIETEPWDWIMIIDRSTRNINNS